jgi:hypothetical protein
MPEIRSYNIDVDVDIDVEIDEFLENCSSRDIEEVIEWLTDSDYIKPNQVVDDIELPYADAEYLNTISKLNDTMARLRLSDEDLATIKQIADKL